MSAAPNRVRAQIEFREAGHQYLLGGRVLTHITQITDYFGGFSQIPKEVRDHALAFGRAVHFACELSDRGTLDEATCAPRVLACVRQYRQFLQETGAQVLATEEIVFHSGYDYAGRLDRRMRLNGRHAIIELKTGQAYPAAGPQTAAQALAFEHEGGEPVALRFSLHLNPDRSRAMLVPHKDAGDRATFVAMLQTWRWVKAHAA